MRRLFIPTLAFAMTGCAAIDWAGTEEEFIQRMEPVRKLMRPDEFDNSYRNALLESRPLPLTPSGTGRVAFLRKGSNCLYSSRSGGVTGPDRLGENPIAGKVVVFDQQGEPRFQLAQSTGDRFELMDTDGDASTLELVRWSDRCEGSRPPFLVIYRLSDLSATPMLALTLNPDAGQIRYTNTWDEKGEWTGRSMNKPHRKGRWRFEGSDILIEELLDGAFRGVARFVLNEDRTAWRGPTGGDHELWKDGADPWVDAIFVRFSDLPQGRFFRGGNHGEPKRK